MYTSQKSVAPRPTLPLSLRCAWGLLLCGPHLGVVTACDYKTNMLCHYISQYQHDKGIDKLRSVSFRFTYDRHAATYPSHSYYVISEV